MYASKELMCVSYNMYCLFLSMYCKRLLIARAVQVQFETFVQNQDSEIGNIGTVQTSNHCYHAYVK